MIDKLRLVAAAILAAALISFESISVAAPVASDSASDPAYAAEAGGAWKAQYNAGDPYAPGQNPPGTDNGGFGFQTWNFTDGSGTAGGYNDPGTLAPYGPLNHFIDGVDFATSAYNNLGVPAFALGTAPIQYGQSNALRKFAQPLAIGQTFSADIDTPAAYEAINGDTFPFVIIRFLSASGAPTLILNAGSSRDFGDFPWKYSDAFNNTDFGVAAGVGSMAPTVTSDGSSFSLLRTGASTGRLSLDGASVDVTFSAGVPAGILFILYENSAEGSLGNPTGEHAFFFNNLQIVPEPSSLAMMLLAGLALIGAKFRGRP
jgi:hypothetical protein